MVKATYNNNGVLGAASSMLLSRRNRVLASLSITAAISVTASLPAQAQSLFDNGEGKGSLPLRAGSRFDFNFGEKLASLTLTTSPFARLKENTNKVPLGAGTLTSPMSNQKLGNFKRSTLSLRGTPDGNAANLFGSNRPGVGAGITLGYGIDRLTSALPSDEDIAITTQLFSSIEAENKENKEKEFKELEKIKNAISMAKNALKAARKLPENDREAAVRKAEDDIKKSEIKLIELEKKLSIWKISSLSNLKSESEKEIKWLDGKIKVATESKTQAEITLNSATTNLEKRIANEKLSKFQTELDGLNDEKIKLNNKEGSYSRFLKDRLQSIELLSQQSAFFSNQNVSKRLIEAIEFLNNGHEFTSSEVADLRSPFGMRRRVDFDRVDFRVSLDYDRFQLADKDANGNATQISDKSFTRSDVLVSYSMQFGNDKSINALGEKKSGSPVIIGVATGYGRFNNKGDLEAIGDSGAFQRSEFKESKHIFVNTDIAYLPGSLDNRVGFNFFTRNNFSSSQEKTRYGIGAFITEKGNPFKSVGGIAISRTSKKDIRVDLITGYSF
jgi:hypothetical protein